MRKELRILAVFLAVGIMLAVPAIGKGCCSSGKACCPEGCAKAQKCCPAGAKKGASCSLGQGCTALCKDADYQVHNLRDGVTVYITSDKPETASAIQRCYEKCEKKDFCVVAGGETLMKDVKTKVSKVKDGVVLTVTADNEETVKKIQECFAKHCSRAA